MGYNAGVTVPQTYPGTVTPLRGLLPFGESDRDVLFGREEELAELNRLVVGEGYRAGLLFGASGVGKTSLLHAGLLPMLRDQGTFALMCDDVHDPVRSFANQLLTLTGVGAAQGEAPVQYIARVVSEAVHGQLYVFIVDGLESVLDHGDEVLAAYAELYARVVSRSGGRARFLFSCAAEKVYALGALERKTGSLFPPSNRFELKPFSVEVAKLVLERTVALAGLATDPSMIPVLANALARNAKVLPADLQIAALASRELALHTPAQLEELGGVVELQRAWVIAAAERTGDGRSALRLLGELAAGDGLSPIGADVVAVRANVDPDFASHALASLESSVLVRAVAVASTGERGYCLVHAKLAEPAREIAAPAREAARRAFDLLGSKAQSGGRLQLFEWLSLRREGISPSTGEEAAVVARTKRFFYSIFGAVAAAPIILIIVIYISLSGHFYLDVGRPAGGGKKTVVVRQGRPALSAFFWLPGGYGDVVADTGFTRAMVGDKSWKAVADEEFGGDDEGMAYVHASLSRLKPEIAARIAYAKFGKDEDFERLASSVDTTEELVALLTYLAPVARGGSAEMALVEESLSSKEPSVQNAALAVVANGAGRDPEIFALPLARVLGSGDVELRRLAITAVRGLADNKQSEKVISTALTMTGDAEARRDLIGLDALSRAATGPSAVAATAALRDRETSVAATTRARSELERAFKSSPKEAVLAAAALAVDAEALPEQRVFALEMLFELAPEEHYVDLKETAVKAKESKSEPVEVAAIPLFARVAPSDAAGYLASLSGRKMSVEIRRAVALAWGEIAKTDRQAAIAALEPLLGDSKADVRAAAARAFGNVGRSSQATLIKMVKTRRYDVAIGAAYGLANSAAVGASPGVAVGGIYDLWKRKGKPRRQAARVFAKLARKRPGSVFHYLVAAARARDDLSLHPLGAVGLCNAYGAGHKRAIGELSRAGRDESVEVRRLVMQCLVDSSKAAGKSELAIARRMARDSDVTIRVDAASVLARAALAEGTPKSVVAALAKLAQDKSREPRMIAIRALGTLGTDVPEAVLAALPVAFVGAPESDKLDILEVGRQLGAGGLVGLASTDESPSVRIAAISTAIATSTDVSTTINAALTDVDPSVRQAALERIAVGKSGLDSASSEAALRLAIRDDNESISDLALATLARLGEQSSARAELGRRLEHPSERVRAQAARAGVGLAETDAQAAIEMLEPLLDDPSHDVRVALVPALGKAMALAKSPGELAKALRKSERHATRRWIALGALLTLAKTDAGADAAATELTNVAKDGPPMARFAAELGLGLLEGKADGLAFVRTLVP